MREGIEVPVRGGKLYLQLKGSDPDQLVFEYRGFVPLDWAAELVRNTPGVAVTVGGVPLLEWLEALGVTGPGG